MFIAVTVIICNKQQQNYRSTCKLHLNYKLYNTLNIKTNKSTHRAQTTTTVIPIDTQVIKLRQISNISYFFRNTWTKI